MHIRYIVALDEEERMQLQELTSAGKARVRRVKRAQILLAVEQGHGDAMVAATVGVGTSTVYRTKRRFVEQGLEAALSGSASGGGTSQAHRARGGVARRGGVFGPAGGASALDAGVAGRGDGGSHRARTGLARDGPSAIGRAIGQAMAAQDVVHSPASIPSTLRGWKRCSTSIAKSPTRAERWCARQSLGAQPRSTLRGLRAGGGPRDAAPAGVPFRPQARELAQ